jgi:Rrf2 family protein
MRLTKQTSHAIRILIDCARGDCTSGVAAPIKVAVIAQRLGITQQNVFKIVHVLSRAGFIKATRGRNGGVQLARPAVDIRIGDVVRATETTHIEVDDDAINLLLSSNPTQPINSLLDDALAAFITVLDQHTLADMARQSTATHPLVTEPQRRGTTPRGTTLKPSRAAPKARALE